DDVIILCVNDAIPGLLSAKKTAVTDIVQARIDDAHARTLQVEMHMGIVVPDDNFVNEWMLAQTVHYRLHVVRSFPGQQACCSFRCRGPPVYRGDAHSGGSRLAGCSRAEALSQFGKLFVRVAPTVGDDVSKELE